MSYSEEEYEDKGDEFVAEFAARERVGSGKAMFIDVKIDGQKGKKGRLSLKNELSPDQMFLYDLQKNYYNYQDDIRITPDDIELIKVIVLKISHIEYKNPLAFLLAFSILDKKERSKEFIVKENLTRVKTILKDVDGIELEDVIRYARLIHKYI